MTDGWNQTDYQTYLTVAGWLNNNLAQLARDFLVATGRLVDGTGWKLDGLEAREESITVLLEHYAGCGEYEYEEVNLLVEYVLASQDERRDILAEEIRYRDAERQRLADEKARQEAAEAKKRQDAAEARDQREYERLKEKFG